MFDVQETYDRFDKELNNPQVSALLTLAEVLNGFLPKSWADIPGGWIDLASHHAGFEK